MLNTAELEYKVMDTVSPVVQEALLKLVQQIVISLPEMEGLQLMDELKMIASGCYDVGAGRDRSKDN